MEFISCDQHNGIPAVNIHISDTGAVRFICLSCEIHIEAKLQPDSVDVI